MVGRRKKPTNIKQEEKAACERQESQIYADNQKIIAALQRIDNQQTAYAQQQKTEYDRQNTWECRRFWLEVSAVIAAFLGAIILFCTLYVTYQAFVDNGRAWIAVKDIGFIAVPQKIGDVMQIVSMRQNIGKGPAISVLNFQHSFWIDVSGRLRPITTRRI